MTYFRSLAAAICSSLLAACTDYAIFVTSTDLGINLDAKTEALNIGYVRTEVFHGPSYPTEGAAPSVVGFISSDLSPFSPNVKQLYATGAAAELVTQNKVPDLNEKEQSDNLGGPRRPFFFGTGTNFGLRVGFTQEIPSSVKIGFNREELSVIPMQQRDPTTGQPDKYASVLASINMDDTSVTTPSDTRVRPTQFFATGAAARNLARRPEFRSIFDAQAKTAVQQAANPEAVAAMKNRADSKSDAIANFFYGLADAQFAAERDALLNRTGLPANDREFIKLRRMTKSEFLDYMKTNSGTAALLAAHLSNR
jgi:hypothetical protein